MAEGTPICLCMELAPTSRAAKAMAAKSTPRGWLEARRAMSTAVYPHSPEIPSRSFLCTPMTSTAPAIPARPPLKNAEMMMFLTTEIPLQAAARLLNPTTLISYPTVVFSRMNQTRNTMSTAMINPA